MRKTVVTRHRTIANTLRERANVINAVILRDVRSRYFNHGLGFFIQSLWPLVHCFILLVINTAVGRSAPYGDSPLVFFGAGVVPTLSFMYISRFMGLSIVLNQNMLSFPAVRVTDIMFARALLEVIAGFITLFMIWIIFLAIGASPYPNDPAQAVFAYLTTIFLAVGVGSIVSVVSSIFPLFVTAYALITILLYLASGCLFVTPNLPDQLAVPLSYNPLAQCVEWMRVAYFENYSDRLLDRGYPLAIAGVSLLIGLLAEKLTKRAMMDS
ncbi:ABC transporter permease [Rhizobium sp. ZPR3]|uniref:ABC transporter permease n=2 Tax=unclassified Rhizobium TaxID=2613769 RepID=A0AAU7SAM5_9HYPH